MFIKESNEFNQQIYQKILEELELLSMKIEENSDKSVFNILDFLQMDWNINFWNYHFDSIHLFIEEIKYN